MNDTLLYPRVSGMVIFTLGTEQVSIYHSFIHLNNTASRQHSQVCACGYHLGITPSPQPLWLGTPVKAAGNTLVLRKLLQIQYQDLRVLCLGYKVNVDTANHHL